MRSLIALLAASLFTLACGDIDDHTWTDDAIGEQAAALRTATARADGFGRQNEEEEMPFDGFGRQNEEEEMPFDGFGRQNEEEEMPFDGFGRQNEEEEMPHDLRGDVADGGGDDCPPELEPGAGGDDC